MDEGTPIPRNGVSAPIGRSNAVLRARARTHFVRDFPGPLSIKAVTEGTVSWKVGGRNLMVDADSFLVLREGEPYSLEIDSPKPVSTLCIFFQPGFVESVHASMGSQDLDPGERTAPALAALHRRDAHILPRMYRIAAGGVQRDEHFLELAADLALLDRDLRRRIRIIPARSAATRGELFRRVSRAQEYLHAHPAGANLDVLAREACLSIYHFHRAFTAAFGQTPHQYGTAVRLARARRLLERSELTVTEIAGAVGFESAASFSLLFRRTYGMPPTAVRKIRNFR